METYKIIRHAMAVSGVLGGLLFTGSASAIVLQGEFSLISGANLGVIGGQNIAVGTVVGQGTYATEDYDLSDPSTTFELIELGANNTSYQYTAVSLAYFNLDDIFGNTFEGGSDIPGNGDFVAPEPFAVLDAVGGPDSGVDFLVGDTGVLLDIGPGLSGTASLLQLGFDQDGVTGEYTLASGTASVNLLPFAIDLDLTINSGNQQIPEPTSIALLGAGMLAFGTFRRRKSLFGTKQL